MTDQETFEDQIRANSANQIARLVYADWLDEHDDPEYAKGMREAPDWFISRDNGMLRELPNELREQCKIWVRLKESYPSIPEKQLRVFLGTSNLLEILEQGYNDPPSNEKMIQLIHEGGIKHEEQQGKKPKHEEQQGKKPKTVMFPRIWEAVLQQQYLPYVLKGTVWDRILEIPWVRGIMIWEEEFIGVK